MLSIIKGRNVFIFRPDFFYPLIQLFYGIPGLTLLHQGSRSWPCLIGCNYTNYERGLT